MHNHPQQKGFGITPKALYILQEYIDQSMLLCHLCSMQPMQPMLKKIQHWSHNQRKLK
jgi:hypothetical protein